MTTLRFYVWPSGLAAMVLSVPLAVVVGLIAMTYVSLPQSFADWLTVLCCAAVADLIVAVLPFIFYLVARVSWREKERVVREHLFGWPLALGVVCFLLAVLATAVVGDLSAFWTIVYLVVSTAVAVSGVIASRIWLRLSYL